MEPSFIDDKNCKQTRLSEYTKFHFKFISAVFVRGLVLTWGHDDNNNNDLKYFRDIVWLSLLKKNI